MTENPTKLEIEQNIDPAIARAKDNIESAKERARRLRDVRQALMAYIQTATNSDVDVKTYPNRAQVTAKMWFDDRETAMALINERDWAEWSLSSENGGVRAYVTTMRF